MLANPNRGKHLKFSHVMELSGTFRRNQLLQTLANSNQETKLDQLSIIFGNSLQQVFMINVTAQLTYYFDKRNGTKVYDTIPR
eukprot:m.312667 g.312667  ORF g.312667 m.312667 type:complete len:83 (+) comp292610_c0_seq1:63-311(+)